MLDIINGKIVTVTGEGCFEITPKEAHRAITIHFLELLENNKDDEDTIRNNYKTGLKLYNIGAKIYKDQKITSDQAREDLMPLIDCVVQDIGDRHLAYLVMRYVTRAYAYRIRERHEIDSLYDFFHALRDPVFTLVLKKEPTYDLFYRIDTAFYEELGQAHRNIYREDPSHLDNDHCKDTIDAFCYIRDNNEAFTKAVKEGKPLPKSDKNRLFGKMVQDIIILPKSVAEWGRDLKINGHMTEEQFDEIADYLELVNIAYLDIASTGQRAVDYQYTKFRKEKVLEQTYVRAKYYGNYNICYYISLRIGSDLMRKTVARWAGVNNIYSDHNTSRRFFTKVFKITLLVLAAYIGYKIVRAIYDFIAMPTVFWILAVPCISALFSTPESRQAAAFLTTTSPYKRARIEQGIRQEKQLKELNENLKAYNTALMNNGNGFRHF